MKYTGTSYFIMQYIYITFLSEHFVSLETANISWNRYVIEK